MSQEEVYAMRGTLTVPVCVLAVFLVGSIAGLLVGTAIEQKTLEVLEADAWVQARHSTDAVFSRVLPWWWNASLLLLFFAAYLRAGNARWMFLVAGSLLLAGIVITLVVEVPINKQVVRWQPGDVPAEWTSLRDRWWRFHVVRSAMGVGAFFFAVLGLAG